MNSYWNDRYKSGGNSGLGSYGDYAKHKADVINGIISKYKIETISDFGCGDGNQISLMSGYTNYSGFDISEYVIDSCRERFKGMPMAFYSDILKLPSADLCLSLDVLYHILDEKDYILYLEQLFTKSNKYVLIFSSNHDRKTLIPNTYFIVSSLIGWINIIKNLH